MKVVRQEIHERAIATVRGTSIQPSYLATKLYDIGGYEEAKELIRSIFIHPIQYPDLYARLGVNKVPGMILYGPSGTGKTSFARAIANESGLHFMQIRPSDVLNSLAGESVKKISVIFELARATKPSLLYFDEMDALFRIRSSSDAHHHGQIVNQLLIEIDGIENNKGIYLLGSTNMLDLIDPAVLRPGRFGLKVKIELPNEYDREQIIMYYINKLQSDNIMFTGDLTTIIEQTNQMSGSE